MDASTPHQKYRWMNVAATERVTQTVFGTVTYPEQVPCTPKIFYSNGPQGVAMTDGVTSFPVPLAVAATWNLDLGYDKGAAQAAEAFDRGSNVILGPGVSSQRTPLTGRSTEYFGEDSLLSGLMAGANSRGIEEGNPTKPVISNLKHYVGNEQELDRQTSSSNVDERTLHQVYTLPFDIAVESGAPDSAMCSYNQINGVFACENSLMNTQLRGEASFDGFVMSDFGSVHSVAQSVKAGLDQELNDPTFFTPANFDAAIAAGELTAADIDAAVFRVINSYIRAGLFDNPLPTTPISIVTNDQHKAISRQVAEQSTVLLQNEGGTLPIAAEAGKTIAIIGQIASTTPTAGVSAKTVCSSFFRFRNGPIMNCDGLIDPLTAITQRAEANGQTVVYSNGADPAQAASIAASADVAVVLGYYTSGEFSDIPDLRLDNNGDALISAVAAANDSTVVILETGSAVEMPWIDSVDSVLEAWYPGDQQGPAFASLLFGDVNPSGKLPLTFPKSLADNPTAKSIQQYPGVFSDGSTTRPAGTNEIRQVNYTEGLQVGYKWYDEQNIDPLFEFGYGLSYTEFEYSNLKVKTKAKNGEAVSTISFTVENAGDRNGAEIPQVYLTLPDAANEPGKRLVGFDRIELAAGERTTVEIVVDSNASNQPFGVWDVDADAWKIVDGTYTISVGASSRDLPLEQDFKVKAK
ncbi:beta-glucosidase [Microbacterium sp. P5_E9]